jgi:mitogen-activated protein kinase kinase
MDPQDDEPSSPEPRTPTLSDTGDSADPSPVLSNPATSGGILAHQVPNPLPSLRTYSDPPPAANMTSSSTPLGNVNAARRPPQPPPLASRSSGFSQDIQAKMKAFSLSRQGVPQNPNLRLPGSPVHSTSTGNIPTVSSQVPGGPFIGGIGSPSPTTGPAGGALVGGLSNIRGLPPNLRPQAPNWSSDPTVQTRMSPKGGLAAKRGLNRGMKLSDATGPTPPPRGVTDPSGDGQPQTAEKQNDSAFSKYSEYVDTKTGTLKFKNKAVIHGKGIDFSGGSSFTISLDEVDTLDELGKGNYGTVYKVRHSRPSMRKPGQGLRGNRPHPSLASISSPLDEPPKGGLSGVVMAMKEIRLELDEAKFAAIIMELDVLHRCVSPFIIDFYGAFFQEGAVYICMEFMDGGSIDKLYGDGVPENVLRKITLSTVMGLKSLKDDHNIIHRDVKPTNILVNTRGQVKICDFGVSGNLVASIAKTNIGCQSYMAPERISGGGIAQAGANPGGGTYSVQSDIWSLALTIIECAMGRYPYPPETYNNIFSQLSVSSSYTA